MKAVDAKKAIQKMADHSQKWHDRTSTRTRSSNTSYGLPAIQAQLNNLGKEIKNVNEKVYVAQVGFKTCKGSHYTKDCPLKDEAKAFEESYYTNLDKVLQERGSGSLPGTTETNPRDHVKSILNNVEAYTPSIRRIGRSRYTILDLQNRTQFFKPNQSTIPFPSRLIDDYYEEMNVLDSTTYLDKMIKEGPRMGYQIKGSTYVNNLATIKDSLPQKEKDLGIFTLPCYINNICFEKSLVDLGASVSIMPLTTFTNLGLGNIAPTKLTVELADRSIKLPKGISDNILVGFEFKRNQVIDFGLIIEEQKVIDEPMIDLVKARTGFELANANFFSILSINVMSKMFYNSIMKEKVGYKGKNVVGSFMSVPIFVGKFYVLTDFAVVETMDAYHNEGIGDVIVGEPFCRASCMEARRIDGLITIHNGNDSVTYQMVRSHLRFKYLTNEECNKISPLLKVSVQDKLNGILHQYQKLKSFYKEVLNLGPEYIRDEKVVERLTHGHTSVHDMK
nr:hypothetical protein [Tanacetum cinerariifolium]